ncbi:MAG: hypothetical protein PHR53_03385 [Bacteroidales bacterium]|nr:hypothetical protein [Bacteroidales bacterium]
MKPNAFNIILLDDLSPQIEESLSFIQQCGNKHLMNITVLHILDKEHEALFQLQNITNEEAEQTLHQRIQSLSQQWNLDLNLHFEKGNIFETIPKIADDIHAQLILFHPHNITPFQERTASNAFRLIEKSTIPIVVIHSLTAQSFDKIITNSIDNIHKITDLLNINDSVIENMDDCTRWEKALIIFQLPSTMHFTKEQQKSIEKLIFNDAHLPVIFRKEPSSL